MLSMLVESSSPTLILWDLLPDNRAWGSLWGALRPRWGHSKAGNQLYQLSWASFRCSSWYVLNRRKVCFEYSHFSYPIYLNKRELHSASSVNTLPFTRLNSYDFPPNNPLNLLFNASSTTAYFQASSFSLATSIGFYLRN